MRLQEWIQNVGNRYKLENGQGIALGGGVYGKYYENTPRKQALPPPAPQPLTLTTNESRPKENNQNQTQNDKAGLWNS